MQQILLLDVAAVCRPSITWPRLIDLRSAASALICVKIVTGILLKTVFNGLPTTRAAISGAGMEL